LFRRQAPEVASQNQIALERFDSENVDRQAKNVVFAWLTPLIAARRAGTRR
jgi:hypothetical protein